MKIKNVTEDLVLWKLPETIPYLHCCTCSYCRRYLIAGTLNRLQPRYVASQKDYLTQKSNILSPQFNADLTAAIILTSKELEVSPKHPKFIYHTSE